MTIELNGRSVEIPYEVTCELSSSQFGSLEGEGAGAVEDIVAEIRRMPDISRKLTEHLSRTSSPEELTSMLSHKLLTGFCETKPASVWG
jgi:hypothetical protein